MKKSDSAIDWSPSVSVGDYLIDGVVTVEDDAGESHALGESLARSVFVRNDPGREGGHGVELEGS